MNSTLRLYASNVAFEPSTENSFAGGNVSPIHRSLYFRPAQLQRRFPSFSVKSLAENTIEPSSPPHHVAMSAIWLFFSAIPALLLVVLVVSGLKFQKRLVHKAFRRAAESPMDITREELPSTMAAIRLSGMEISDPTMELSDLGDKELEPPLELSGSRGETPSIDKHDSRLLRSFVLVVVSPEPKTAPTGPVVAKIVRELREGIVKGGAFLQIIFTLTISSRMALGFILHVDGLVHSRLVFMQIYDAHFLFLALKLLCGVHCLLLVTDSLALECYEEKWDTSKPFLPSEAFNVDELQIDVGRGPSVQIYSMSTIELEDFKEC
ncbi:hypothetical protein RJ641_010350 [Dillenia turbinata]|uniref:Uncharacterized protein n=1 Tax=Dillenia turbinata TaxID=194707 RepID=A0AAN8Z6C3_9MAGN